MINSEINKCSVKTQVNGAKYEKTMKYDRLGT